MSAFQERGRKWLLRLVPWVPLALPLYLVRFQIGPLPTTLLEVILLGFFGLFTATDGIRGWKEGWQKLGAWRYPVVAWVVASLIAVLVSPSLVTGLGLWRAYVLEPALLFIFLQVVLFQPEAQERLKRSLYLIVFPVVAWGVWQFVSGQGIPHPWDVSIALGRRATGPYPFPNALALFVAPIGALAFAEWLRTPKRWFLLATTLVAGIGILLTKSDGAAFGLAVAIGLVLVGSRRGRFVVLIGAILGSVVLAGIPSLRYALWQQISFQGWSGKVRLIMWGETWQMLKAHWFTGAGFGGYPIVFDAFHKKRFIEIFQYPHTLLFNFWTETGLLGVAAFTSVIIVWVRKQVQVLRARGYAEAIILLAPLITILVHGLVDVAYFKNDLAVQFWLFAALASLASVKVVQVERGKVKTPVKKWTLV